MALSVQSSSDNNSKIMNETVYLEYYIDSAVHLFW